MRFQPIRPVSDGRTGMRLHFRKGRVFRSSEPGGLSLSMLILALLVVCVLFYTLFADGIIPLLGETSGDPSVPITASTVSREPLEKGAVTETAYYTDGMGVIQNNALLLSGLKYFYKETGVQPFLYLTDNIDGIAAPADAQIAAFSEKLYDALFTDEAHMLVVFVRSGDTYTGGYLCGDAAKTVIDDEAGAILFDYFSRFVRSEDLTYEQFFKTTFTKAADHIMKGSRSPWPLILIGFGIVVLTAVTVSWRLRVRKQRKQQMQVQISSETLPEKPGGEDIN